MSSNIKSNLIDPSKRQRSKKRVRFNVYETSNLKEIQQFRIERLTKLNSFINERKLREELKVITTTASKDIEEVKEVPQVIQNIEELRDIKDPLTNNKFSEDEHNEVHQVITKEPYTTNETYIERKNEVDGSIELKKDMEHIDLLEEDLSREVVQESSVEKKDTIANVAITPRLETKSISIIAEDIKKGSIDFTKEIANSENKEGTESIEKDLSTVKGVSLVDLKEYNELEADITGNKSEVKVVNSLVDESKIQKLVNTLEKISRQYWLNNSFNKLKTNSKYKRRLENYHKRIYKEFELNRKSVVFNKFRQVCKAQYNWINAVRNVLIQKELLLYFNCLKLHTLYNKYKRHRIFILTKKYFQILKAHKEISKRKGTIAWYYSMIHKSLYALKVFTEHNKAKRVKFTNLIKNLNLNKVKRIWNRWMKSCRLTINRQRYIGITITQKNTLLAVKGNENFKFEQRNGINVVQK